MSTSADISSSDFEEFRTFFRSKTGVCFDSNKRYFVDRRLLERINATGKDNFDSYFRFVRQNNQEFQCLVNSMTINETYFFREEYQLDSMVSDVMDDVLSRRGPGYPIRIWSIPCASGEEPYSIAIKLLEEWGPIDSVDVEILGSDIDTQVLDLCKQGIYGDSSMRNVASHIRQKYFRLVSKGRYQINEELRNVVCFDTVNLSDSVGMKKYRNLDLIFCRNLLIYFDLVKQKEAIQALYDAMNPGGYIFLGHSESMAHLSGLFKVAKSTHSLIYQKPI